MSTPYAWGLFIRNLNYDLYILDRIGRRGFKTDGNINEWMGDIHNRFRGSRRLPLTVIIDLSINLHLLHPNFWQVIFYESPVEVIDEPIFRADQKVQHSIFIPVVGNRC